MPSIGRQPFERQMPKPSLLSHGDREMFYCKHTNEIFADYESLFQRVILCNSLVWTCSLTSRAGLTFQEALESEKKARAILKTFPNALKRPVLYVATLTRRTKINDLCEDVYGYMKNHFFVGETVEVVINGTRKTVQVASAVSSSSPKSPSKAARSPSKTGSPRKGTSSSQQKKYIVCEENQAEEIQICHEVLSQNMNRVKGVYNKDKNKLFLKQNVVLKNGVLAVKDNVIEKNSLEHYSLKSSCGGEEPVFEKTPIKNIPVVTNKKNGKKENKNGQMDISKAIQMQKPSNKKAAQNGQVSLEDESLTLEQLRKKHEEARLKKIEDQLKAKEKKKEERRLMAEYIREFNKPRDDLECDDLKDLPVPIPVNCNIPHEVFGDAMIIVEFMALFGHMFKLRSVFPSGVSFELLDRAVSETDIDGPFNDILQMMLLAVFKQQESEDEEQKGFNKSVAVNQMDALDEDADPTTAKAIEAAKVAATWSQFYHGTILRKMPLDPFTVSELFRLHILASGSEVSRHINRMGERGFYLARENPGLYFKKEEPEIVKDLSTGSVFQLRADQKIKTLKVLIEQLLTYDSYREYIDEETNVKKELTMLRYYYSRRGKDDKMSKKKAEDNKPGKDNAKELETPASEETSEEKAAKDAQKAEEDAKALEEFQKKEKDLVSQLAKLKGVSGVFPIGEDRAFRRYWVFRSVGGIFVEDDNPFLGECSSNPTPTQSVPPTIGNKSQDEVPLSLIKRYLSVNKTESQNGQSDKENEASEASHLNNHIHSKSQKLLSDANPRMNSPSKARQTSESSEITKPRVFGMCTADMATCPVHGSSRSITQWGFFNKEHEIEQLIAGLNPRGEREGKLRDFFFKEKSLLTESLENCPISKLNYDVIVDEQEVRKSNRHKSAFANVHPSDALETTLREALLDNEEKLWGGGLGYIKVKDRDAWRNAIEERRYEMLRTDLKFGRQQIRLPQNTSEEMSLDSEQGSHRSSSPLEPNQLITDMASALLQVAQAVEPRYLIAPLGEDAKYKQKKQQYLNKLGKLKEKDQKESDDESSDDGQGSNMKIPASPLERWEESLMSCSSLSQLFVHLATLEKSILWERSASKANCKICRRKGDPEKMLLCDGCDRGYHMYCLKPPLKVVPTGDWFCPPCEPPAPLEEKIGKNRRKLNYKESDDEEEDEEQDSDDDNEDDSEAEENQNRCKKCNKGGQLLCCDSCLVSYHLRCLNPPLRRVPRGDWNCPKCLEKTSNKRKPSEAKKVEPEKKSPRLRKPTVEITTSSKKAEPEKKSSRLRKPTVEITPSSTSRSSRRQSAAAASNDNLPLDYQGCSQLLDQLTQHPDSWPFRKPVTKKEAPNYHRIIKRPIDLGMIRSRLNNQTYQTNESLIADIYLMFQNCEVYNGSETGQYESGRRLARYFQTLSRQYKLDDSNSTRRKASFDGAKEIPTKKLRRMN